VTVFSYCPVGTMPAALKSHVSPGSSIPLPFVSPTILPVVLSNTGVTSNNGPLL
jgi:hypothetical protein